MMTSNTYQFINLDYMRLMADSDLSMMKIMLDMLLEELPVELEKMKNSMEKKDWTELGNLSHKMKSTLAYVGNDEMTVSNKAIETLVKSEDHLDEVESLVCKLDETYQKVLPELMMEASKL